MNLTAAIYEPDIKLIRGELTARALIMKDLRLALTTELSSIDQELALRALSGNETARTTAERQWLAGFLFKLLDPYAVFKDTYDPESINLLFRYWWLDFERFLKEKESRHESFLRLIKGSAPRLVRPIARTLDAIEKAEGGRMLYARFLEKTQATAGIDPAFAIDNWLRGEGKSSIGAFIPQLSLLSQGDQEPLIERLVQVAGHVKESASFAKAIQAVKTFEPERMDSLLEIFSIFPFVESFEQPPLIRLQNQVARMEESIRRLDEELIVELGLLDKKARMESGYAINNLLPQTLLRVPPLIALLTDRLHALQQLSDPYVASIAHFLLEDTAQLSHDFEAITDLNQDALFSVFQKLTVLMFHRKMLDNALQPKNFARILLLLTAIGQIVRRFRQMEEKGELISPLIDELDAISAGQWDIVAPDLLKKNELLPKLQKFLALTKKLLTAAGLTERREGLLASGIEKVYQELSEEIVFDIPRLSFVPGDLNYFWHSEQQA